MGKLYTAGNWAMPTTAAPVAVTTGTTIKTMLQVKPGANTPIRIVEWGFSTDGSAAATPGKVELVETGTVFATVTAYAAADVQPFNDPNAPASLISLGTTASGFTASAEGTTTATRQLDTQFIDPLFSYLKQFPLGREPEVKAGSALRIRCTFGTAVNAYCYVVWEE